MTPLFVRCSAYFVRVHIALCCVLVVDMVYILRMSVINTVCGDVVFVARLNTHKLALHTHTHTHTSLFSSHTD